MTFFLQLVVTGFTLGMVYALIAIGFVIILKCSNAFNIAQGHFVLIGGYLGYTFLVLFGLPIWAIVLAIIVSGHSRPVDRTADNAPSAGPVRTGRHHDDHRPGHGPGRIGHLDLGRRIQDLPWIAAHADPQAGQDIRAPGVIDRTPGLRWWPLSCSCCSLPLYQDRTWP